MRRFAVFSMSLCILFAMVGCGKELNTPTQTAATSMVTEPNDTYDENLLQGITIPTIDTEYFELLCDNFTANY